MFENVGKKLKDIADTFSAPPPDEDSNPGTVYKSAVTGGAEIEFYCPRCGTSYFGNAAESCIACRHCGALMIQKAEWDSLTEEEQSYWSHPDSSRT